LKALRLRGASGDVVEWRASMGQSLKEGEKALAELKSLFRNVPSEGWVVQDLWYQAMDLVVHITSGIVCLRTHLEVETVISENDVVCISTS
jgi:hypothetical protein